MGNATYPFYKAWQANGLSPAAGYLLYTYIAGTVTPKATYSDVGLTIANANPIVLNSNGEATIFLKPDANYRFDLKTPAFALINTFDNISSTSAGGGNVRTVASIAALKALAPVSDLDNCLVLGYYGVTDGVEGTGNGGGGMFYYNAGSTQADNQGTVIIPASAPGSGRWIRIQEGPIGLRWFGWKGDGSAGDTTAQTAHATYYAARAYSNNGNAAMALPGSLIINNNPLSAAALILSNKSGNGVNNNTANIIFDTAVQATTGMGGSTLGGIAWAATGANPGTTIPIISGTSASAFITANSAGNILLNSATLLDINIGTQAVPIQKINMNSLGIDISTTKTAVYRNRFSFELNNLQIKSSAVEITDLQFKTINAAFVGGITWPDVGTSSIRASGGGDGSLYITGYSSGLFLRADNGGTTHIDIGGGGSINMYASGVTVIGLTSTAISLALPTTAASTLSSTGNFAVNTNKFTVIAATGNTLVAGTLGVTGVSAFTGNVGIGSAGNASWALSIFPTSMAGGDQYGIVSSPTGTSAATTGITGIYGRANTAVAAYTSITATGLYIEDAAKGAGSTITTQYGININNQTQGGTNYAIKTGTGLVQFGDQTILKLGTTARSSLNIPAGVAPTSPSDGDIWYDGTNIKMRVGAATKTFTLV